MGEIITNPGGVSSLNEAIAALNAETNFDGSSYASWNAAIEAAIDSLANDSKMHVITVTKGARAVLLVQKYSSASYASYVGFGYALTNPINGEKVNGTWTHSTLALKSEMPKTVFLPNPTNVNNSDGYIYWPISSLNVSNISTIKNIAATIKVSGNLTPNHGVGWNDSNFFIFIEKGGSIAANTVTAEATIFFT